jgi:FlaA1/EpsC-like NDP-sugar epimerase
LRPGEKLHEELVTYGEALEPTGIPKINRLRSTLASRVYPKFGKHLTALMAACQTNDNEDEVTALLWETIAQDQKHAGSEAYSPAD